MKGKVAERVSFHVAIQIKGHVQSSLDVIKHKPLLKGPIELLPMGISFCFDGVEMLVPYANIRHLTLKDDK